MRIFHRRRFHSFPQQQRTRELCRYSFAFFLFSCCWVPERRRQPCVSHHSSWLLRRATFVFSFFFFFFFLFLVDNSEINADYKPKKKKNTPRSSAAPHALGRSVLALVPHVLARVPRSLSGVPRSTRPVAIGSAPCSARPRTSLAPRRTSRLARVHHLLARVPRSTRLVANGSAPPAARRRPSLDRPLLVRVPRRGAARPRTSAGLAPVPHRGLPLG